jgi:protoheme IX farnesyltransferase
MAERAGLYWKMFKPKLSGLSVSSTAVAYLLVGGRLDFTLGLLLLGAALLAAGSSFLNQVQERDYDARMERTRGRPLPQGKMSELEVLCAGVLFALMGSVILAQWVHPLAALVGVSILLGYNLLYTPMKRVSALNTFMGAIPGALPVVLGQVGAVGGLGDLGLNLFAIVFLWQLPHFWAISWIYREDYLRGGYVMLSAEDSSGRITSLSALAGSLLLIPVTLLPALDGAAGGAYFGGAFLLGLGLLGASLWFALHPSKASARLLFRASIFYLPLLFVLLLIDKAGY